MLLKTAGSKSKPAGCRINRAEGLRAPTNEIAHRVASSLKIGIGLLARSLLAGGRALPRMTCRLGSRILIFFTLTARRILALSQDCLLRCQAPPVRRQAGCDKSR